MAIERKPKFSKKKTNAAGNMKGMYTDMKAIASLRKARKSWKDLSAEIGGESSNVVSSVDFKHRLFPHEYVRCGFNAKKAAINIGYAPSTAESIAKQLLERYRSKVTALVEEKLALFDVTQTSLAQEMAKLAYVNPNDFYDEKGELIPIHQLPRHVSAAISSFKVERVQVSPATKDKPATYKDVYEYKIWDKKGSTEILMKHLGMIVEKKALTGANDQPLIPTSTKINHTLDVSNLTDDKLKALMTLAGEDDPIGEGTGEED